MKINNSMASIMAIKIDLEYILLIHHTCVDKAFGKQPFFDIDDIS